MKKTVTATWRLELNVYCPFCEDIVNLLDWESGIEREALPEICKSEKDLDIEVECSECKKTFFVNETEF